MHGARPCRRAVHTVLRVGVGVCVCACVCVCVCVCVYGSLCVWPPTEGDMWGSGGRDVRMWKGRGGLSGGIVSNRPVVAHGSHAGTGAYT